MTESFAFSLGKRPIVCILGKRAEETLKVRHKTRKKEGETESESEQIVPFVQRSVLDILEEATATFIFEIGKCARLHSLCSNSSRSSVLDVLDALREFSVYFYVSPFDLLSYMSLEEIALPELKTTRILKPSKKSLLFAPKTHLTEATEKNDGETSSHWSCYESWMPSMPPPSTLVLKQGKVVEEHDREGALKDKGTGQIYAGMRYGLLAQAKGAAMKDNPFLRLPHKAKDQTE